MLLDEIGSYLVAQGLGGFPGTAAATTTGWTICKSFQPPAPDQTVTVEARGGLPNEQVAELDRPLFDVRVRGKALSGSTALTKTAAVRSALEAVNNQTLSGQKYVMIMAIGEVQDAGIDQNNRPEYLLSLKALRSR